MATVAEGLVPLSLFDGPGVAAEGFMVDDLSGPGLTGHQHPETSRESGALDRSGSRHAILAAIVDAGRTGLCAAELVEMGLATSTNIAGSRLIELRGGTARFPDRLVSRVVDIATGRLVKRRGCAIHVATEWPLIDGARWETPPVLRLCKTCGQPVPWGDDEDAPLPAV